MEVDGLKAWSWDSLEKLGTEQHQATSELQASRSYERTEPRAKMHPEQQRQETAQSRSQRQ